MTMSKMAGSLSIFLLLIALVSSCSARTSEREETRRQAAPAPAVAPAAPQIPGREAPSDIPSVQQRLTVRTVNMLLQVDKVREAMEKIMEMAARMEGFVVSAEIRQNDEERAIISIRVPAQRTDDALKTIRGLATRVLEEKQNEQDVTEEFTDLQARLRNMKATEARLLDILRTAKTVQDTLQVQKELSNVQEQIERLQGRIQYLQSRSSTSLISMTLESEVAQKPLVKQGWSFMETLKSSLRGLVVTLQILGTLAVWIAIFSPIWGTAVAVAVYLGRRKSKKTFVPPPVK